MSPEVAILGADQKERGLWDENREFKITTTATGTSLNKRFNEQNNVSARAL